MVEISPEMAGVDAASVALDQLMAADAAPLDSTAAAIASPSATPEQRAAQEAGKSTETKPNSTSPDTLATADPNKPQAQQQKPGEPAAPAKEPTRYEKARQRADSAWQKINEEKAANKTERERLGRERAEYDQARAKQENQYSPDQYDKAAKQFEEQGKFELAEMAKTRAAELRKNPPPTPQQAQVQKQQQDQHAAQMKEWWGKASVDYPEVAKAGSPANTAMRAFLNAEPDAVRSPKGMYYAARLIHAETAAASVPEMGKELGVLRAKVKELEALTGPGPTPLAGRAGQGNEAKTEDERFSDLERQATELGPLR